MDFIIELFNVLSDQLFPTDTTRVYAIAPAAMFALQATPYLFQYFGSKGQTEQGIEDLRKAEQAQAKAISAMRAVEIQNKLEALQVPTLGAEVRERAITRGLGTGVEAAQEGGPEAIIGGLPRMQAQADVASAQIAGDLDTLEAQRDRAVLAQEQAIEMERKQRELDIQNMILGGAGLAAADAQRLQQMGQYGQMQALGGIATAGVGALNPYGMQPRSGAVDTTAITEVASTQPNQFMNTGTSQGGQIINNQQSAALGNTNTQNIGYGMMGRGGMGSLDIMSNYNNYLMNNNLTPNQFTIEDFIIQGG